MTLATTAPMMHPAIWAGRYAAASRHETPPKAASTKETTGLKCPPETGPNIKMMANSPAAVAMAFSKSSRPGLPGESCLRGDARADDQCGQEGAAEELGQQTSPEHRGGHGSLTPVLAPIGVSSTRRRRRGHSRRHRPSRPELPARRRPSTV